MQDENYEDIQNMDMEEFAALQNEVEGEMVAEVVAPETVDNIVPEVEPVVDPVVEPEIVAEVEPEVKVEVTSTEPTEPVVIADTENLDTPAEVAEVVKLTDGTPEDAVLAAIPDEYKAAKKFYDQLAEAEFKANGRNTKVIMDPEKIVQMHQYGFGFHDKNKAINELKPMMKFIKDRGLDANPEQMNFIGDLLDKKPEAIKQLVKESGLDPYTDLEIGDDFKYDATKHMATREEVAIEDVFSEARSYGLEEKVANMMSSELDDKSLGIYMDNEDVRADIMDHMESGLYSEVVARVKEAEAYDRSGKFRNAPFINKYADVYTQMQHEHEQKINATRPPVTPSTEVDQTSVDAAVRKIAEKREADEYAAKNATRQAEIDESRRRAASVTGQGRQQTTPTKQEEFDPLTYSPGEFGDFVDKFLAGEVDL